MSSSIQEKFATKLKTEREARKLSQEELAHICGIHRTHIGRIERMERVPSLIILEKIANGLKMTLPKLLTF